MSPLPRSPRRRLTTALTVPLAAAALLLAATGTVSAAPSGGDGSAADKPAVTKRGDAYMGWSRHGEGPSSPPSTSRQASVAGMDVSGHQGNVNWQGAWNNGARFAYVKATEGNYYKNPYFTQQYNGSYNVGMIRGAYHFATPNDSSGANQANYFVDRGGAWSRDGKTLPGALDIEYNPYGATCYGKTQAQMRSWIADFINTYHSRTGRWATIYSTTDWWTQCTGNYGGFANNNPLWIARYASSPGALPNGWGFYTFWQYNDHGTFPGDQNVFNGAHDRLVALANG